jgi:type III pantothenate kinase
MILAINSGNTHTTVGCVDQTCRVVSLFQIPTDRCETEFGYAVRIREILSLQGVEMSYVEGAIVSCVVPPVTDTLVRAVRLLIGMPALVVGAGIKTGLQIAINDPGTVASDLVAAAVAAKEEYPLPCVVVDMGTATTLTVVDRGGRYVGGAILPGAEISLEALAKETALLPHIEISAPRGAIGTNTVDCMRAGIVYGTAGAVDGMLDRIAEELGEEPASIVATGGVSGVIAPHCRHSMTVDETLLLRGLRLIWDKNQRKRG